MTTPTTEHNLFRPAPVKAAAKSDITTLAARAITKADAEYRTAKTARLRSARLASQAQMPAPVAEGPKRAAKKTSTASSRKPRALVGAK